jgi:hypothetical protein
MIWEPSQQDMDALIQQAQSLPEPTVDDVIEMLPDEAKQWYSQQSPDIQQAFIEEIEQAMQGGEPQ